MKIRFRLGSLVPDISRVFWFFSVRFRSQDKTDPVVRRVGRERVARNFGPDRWEKVLERSSSVTLRKPRGQECSNRQRYPYVPYTQLADYRALSEFPLSVRPPPSCRFRCQVRASASLIIPTVLHLFSIYKMLIVETF